MIGNSGGDRRRFDPDHNTLADVRQELERRPPHYGPYDLKAIITAHLATTRRVLALLPTEDPP